MANTLNSSEIRATADASTLNVSGGSYPLVYASNLLGTGPLSGYGFVSQGATIAHNNQTAPDGTTTASTITANAGAGGHSVYCVPVASITSKFQPVHTATLQTFQLTAIVKAGTQSWMGMLVDNTNGCGYFYNLTTGQLGTKQNNGTATITPVGNGYYLCSYLGSTVSTSFWGSGSAFVLGPCLADNALSYSAAGTETLIVSSVCVQYIPANKNTIMNVSESNSTVRSYALGVRNL
jgi:hypothetical protein